MDPVKILKRAWAILWSYRALWVFGLILALATAGSTSRGSNNRIQHEQNRNSPPMTPHNMQEAFRQAGQELEKLFQQGIPGTPISGQALSTFLWVMGSFLVLMLVIAIFIVIARYVSETAVIRMVDEYEGSGNKMTVRQGFRTGWSNTSWRLFVINLIVNLPAIALVLVLIMAAAGFYFSVANGNAKYTPVTLFSIIAPLLLAIFVVVILSILLRLLRNFFWRICVLEDASVGDSLRRGVAMVRENWKNVGLMWLVMIGLGIVWAVASIILFLVTIPVVILTAILAVLVVAVPFLLLVGAFSLFL
ncbi:MAG TPA: hypothetical protein VK909_18015, partial [Anaerolineales bacterium]|nr:hypothetical protein [Anaerolineales bacterium]